MKLPDSDFHDDGPNLTPVIDVVFLLLIFFLVATTYDQEERELDVDLPEVAQAQPLSMTQDLIVNITRDGKLRVARSDYNENQLLRLIRASQENNPHQSVLIRGDGESAFKYAVRVMGICNKAGIDYRVAAVQEQ